MFCARLPPAPSAAPLVFTATATATDPETPLLDVATADLTFEVALPRHAGVKGLFVQVGKDTFNNDLVGDSWLTGDLVQAATCLIAAKCGQDAIVLPYYLLAYY